MDPARWQQIEALFHAARLLDGTERRAFLESQRVEGPDVIDQVEAMLEANRQASSEIGGIVDSAIVNALEKLPDRIGPYEIVSQIGAGGFCSVYRARLPEEATQNVAIKVLKRGLTSRDAERRLQQESEILARLHHPNIARLLGHRTSHLGESGKVAAVNLVSVEGNSVTIQITVLVDGSDPLFANPFPAAIEPAEIATNDNIPAEAMRARVIRVADGDTLTVMIEDGQLAGFEETIRMLGIDTPETVHPKRPPECYGQQASDFTKATFAGSEAATAIVLVQLDPQTETRDRFGRLLAHLWLEDGRLFNEILLAEGYARHNDYGSASVHKARYTAAEINAQTNQLGLWSACQ
ncbi:MAG: thermonuclease family protein [Chloroflexota bacterium]